MQKKTFKQVSVKTIITRIIKNLKKSKTNTKTANCFRQLKNCLKKQQ